MDISEKSSNLHTHRKTPDFNQKEEKEEVFLSFSED